MPRPARHLGERADRDDDPKPHVGAVLVPLLLFRIASTISRALAVASPP